MCIKRAVSLISTYFAKEAAILLNKIMKKDPLFSSLCCFHL
jgi:hypothetical protein